MNEQNYILELKDVVKTFGGVTALAGVQFQLKKGEIHALMGENGAGKSTFIKVITGVHQPDSGIMLLEGERITPRNTMDSAKLGIAAIYQHVTAFPDLSVTENIFMGQEIKNKLGMYDWRQMNQKAKELIEPLSKEIDVTKPMGSLSVAAQQLVEIAKAEGAQAIAHGATGKGNDQVRFELAINALAPELTVIAPWREWDLMSRTALTEFAEKHDIAVSSSNKHYSMDRNMLHCSFEGGELEDPWEEPGPESYIMAVPVEKAPDEPEYITIDFEKGDAVALNGKRLSPMEMVMELNKIAGKHGIGRLDMVENRFVGMKSRGVYETPGGTVLHVAHQDLEGICLDREALAVRDTLMPRYAAAVYNGFWFSPEREAMQALIDKSQEGVTGSVRLKLYKGTAWPVGRYSPHSLYCHDLATFEECATYDHKDAAGFIRLQGLRTRGYADRVKRFHQ